MNWRICAATALCCGVGLLPVQVSAGSSSNGVYGGYVGSDQWFKSYRDSAAQRAALASMGGAPHGGCNALPHGWGRVSVMIDFPAEYRGYPAWVNMASLLPVGGDLQTFIANATAAESYSRPALRAGAYAVRSTLCGPAGRRYWVVVDSGMARVAVGQVALVAGRQIDSTLHAPPLGQSSGGSASDAGGSTQPESTNQGAPQPSPANADAAPAADTGWKPPQSDNNWKPPKSDNSWKPPQSDNSWKPPHT